MTLFLFQIKDDIKAARIEATKAYRQYAKEPKTSQRRCRFDLELELDDLCLALQYQAEFLLYRGDYFF
jgi:hypothetical protein